MIDDLQWRWITNVDGYGYWELWACDNHGVWFRVPYGPKPPEE